MVLYTIHCVKCKILETLLTKNNFKFDIVDDKDTVVEVGLAHKIIGAPILEVDGNFMDYNAAVKYIKEVK